MAPFQGSSIRGFSCQSKAVHMREYGQIKSGFWRDHLGREWRIPSTPGPLSFRNPSHAALRAFVFQRDAFQCRECGAKALKVPHLYDGRYGITVDTMTGGKNPTNDVLVVDHVLTRRAGGNHHPENLQTLCETCNKRKIVKDRLITMRSRSHG